MNTMGECDLNVISRDVQCRCIMSLVAISVRVTVAIPSQLWIDDPWLTGDCQSNSDGQEYSDKGHLSKHG